ncbi:hypothetical protein FJR38_26915 [Anabaena sp. UHCC 0253]|uniref:hypothetical protein n=1 Tax=Anabaena sp. UHCC 0253 TaxID=2590019 RepID=UPI0014487677|nr:hypothetical protein [Anabaena sp. UHCC 0253]MTJ56022.1 hypothetical protein [Anabaena sp. UHCC 0253]
MAKRFNNLDAALKYLRPTSADEATPTPDAPAGTPLRNYQQYKAKQKKISYVRDAASKPGEIDVVVVKPFALLPTDTTALRTVISARAVGQYGTFGLTEAELGVDTTLQNTDKEAVGFIPAKAICRNVTGTTTSAKVSKVTGESYKTKANASYTFPVGRTTANPSWGQQKAFILSQVAASAGNKSVTFKPEKY